MEERKEKNFEFTLKLNSHIVVQRLFNVSGFNEKATKSMDFKYVVDDILTTIMDCLKNKTMDFMTLNQAKYDADPSFDQNHNDDIFKIIVKANGTEIAYREFNGNIYPSTIRYSVDIRDHIYKIITSIQKILSSKDNTLELTYLNKKLV